MSQENQEALDKAMQELDELSKSEETEETELDKLTKALEEELGEDLEKAKKDDKKEEEGDDEGDDEDMEDDRDTCNKSQEEEYEQELIKASEAFASLEKAMTDRTDALYAEIDVLKKSIASLINLNVKQAAVVASISKSQKETTDSITKSLSALGSQPTHANKAVIGSGSSIDSSELKKSHSEIQDALLKAIQEGKADSRYLSIYSTYRDINKLPVEIQKVIGL